MVADLCVSFYIIYTQSIDPKRVNNHINIIVIVTRMNMMNKK